MLFTEIMRQAFFDRMVKGFATGAVNDADLIAVGGRSAKNLLAAFKSGFDNNISVLSADVIEKLDDIGDEFFGLATEMKVTMGGAVLWILEKLKFLSNSTGQTGAGFGGGWEYAKAQVAVDKSKGISFDSRFANFFENFIKGFQKAVVGTEADQNDFTDQIAIAKNAKREARKRSENSPPPGLNDTPVVGAAMSKAAKTNYGLDALQQAGAYVRGDNSKALSVAEKSEQHLRDITITLKNGRGNTPGGF